VRHAVLTFSSTRLWRAALGAVVKFLLLSLLAGEKTESTLYTFFGYV
jgi:hypothetical protein